MRLYRYLNNPPKQLSPSWSSTFKGNRTPQGVFYAFFSSHGDLIMKDLSINITSSLPVIKGNLEVIKQELVNELKQFDLIVDEDSIKTAKAMATKINKISKDIDILRINEVAKLSSPIKKFEKEAKSLSLICQESRQKLLSQVKVFEDIQKKDILKLLNVELENTYKKYDVIGEYRTVQVADLAILSNRTKTGLAKKARETIDEKALKQKKYQDKIAERLNTLEIICVRAGLESSLTRQNIEHFLKVESDDVYLEKLIDLIKNEVTRFNLMNERKREKETINAVAKVAPPVTQTAQTTQKISHTNSKYAHFKNVQEFPTTNKKRTYTVTATFEVEIEESKSGLLEQLLINKFVKTGFKQIPTVKVEEVRNVA
jgi:hypothetical protein